MKKNEGISQIFSDEEIMESIEGFNCGWGHHLCNPGTDFRKAWIYEKCYMLRRVDSNINRIISARKKRITANPDITNNCRSKVCGGCIDFPKQINFDPRRIFTFYCPKYDIENLCSFRAISYYCDSLHKFLLHLSLDQIDFDLLMEIEGICQEIYKKTYMLVGVHNKAIATEAVYINGPGPRSRAVGQWALDDAYKVLEKYGGIKGYKSLPYGEKKPIRDEIERKLKSKDPRNIYNILKKLEKYEQRS